ncbi:NAD(P)/FAD-dependent oxidoreductase [Vagococcus vulneris]|uniref:Aminoacetone oxidase family FAD-binding enzyme n=1 Tax=Vagococcus vulneris TaxID=1977869 RepID=A0A430A252_9ENTE|nr:NAD(P)/FAD-dependent oxidoreductase [Vagococcus vulneris]RSU00518.1 aminoacetone oxidase family FAD-binding enzyme [Vagococcus vulneris]
MTMFDVIIVGAGTSGLMAAAAAAEKGAKVAVIDKNKRPGKKLRLTGGGRCNVTNNRPPEDIISFIPGNGKFLYSAFSQFNNYDIMNFFESNHIPLKEEDHGRMFPVANTSKAIVDGLVQHALKLGVTFILGTEVKKINTNNKQISAVEIDDGNLLNTHCLILATGGKTYQYTGSTGDGYKLAKQLGHTVTPLYPTESPIKSDEPFIKNKRLQGLALRNIRLSVLNEKGKPIVTHQMDMLFTHFGVSGPAALRCSMFINQQLAKGNKKVDMSLDSLPSQTENHLIHLIHSIQKDTPKKAIKNALKPILPERFLEFLLEQVSIDDSLPINQLTEQQIEDFVKLIKNFHFKVYDTYPLDKSFVTGGGINLKEVTPKTMESKLINGLFFAGELLDINGYTGGYNITAAFVTGHTAGVHAATISSYFNYQ